MGNTEKPFLRGNDQNEVRCKTWKILNPRIRKEYHQLTNVTRKLHFEASIAFFGLTKRNRSFQRSKSSFIRMLPGTDPKSLRTETCLHLDTWRKRTLSLQTRWTTSTAFQRILIESTWTRESETKTSSTHPASSPNTWRRRRTAKFRRTFAKRTSRWNVPKKDTRITWRRFSARERHPFCPRVNVSEWSMASNRIGKKRTTNFWRCRWFWTQFRRRNGKKASSAGWRNWKEISTSSSRTTPSTSSKQTYAIYTK